MKAPKIFEICKELKKVKQDIQENGIGGGETKQTSSASLIYTGRLALTLQSWKDRLVILDTSLNLKGDAFSVSGHEIKVNRDMTVLLSAQISTFQSPQSSQFSAKIVGSASGLLALVNSNTMNDLMSHTITPVMRKIKAGETIGLYLNTQVAGDYTIISDSVSSYLTIQEVSEGVETAKVEGLVERGHNERGYYEKYSDGILKCWSSKEFGTIDINTAFGALFVSSALTLEDFPVSFADKPVLTKWLENGGSSAWLINGLPYSTTENPGGVNLVAVVTGSAINVKVMYMAVGRWKEEIQVASEEGGE